MTDTSTARRDPHDEVQELLAWYANDTLPAGDAARVEEHLRGCLACRQELAFLDGLRRTLAEPDDLLLSPERSLGPLASRIGALAAGRRGHLRWLDVVGIVVGRLRHLLARPAAPLQIGLAASLVALALSLVWVAHSSRQPRFHTLGDAVTAAPASGSMLRVVFAAELPVSEIQRLLRDVGGSIAQGPSAWGVYTVELRPGIEVGAALERLREHPGVRFAEPGAAVRESPDGP